jgi:hypothetical protein
MITVRPPCSHVTGTRTRTRPAPAGSAVGFPIARTGPLLPVRAAHPARSASADTTARSGAANRSSTSAKRPSRAISVTAKAIAAGLLPPVTPTATFLMLRKVAV